MIRIGTAGWSIASRHAASFPGEGSHLARYARGLNAAEINSSFYRPHRRQTYERWAGSVPETFRFSVKVPKAVSHVARLAGCGDLIAAFTAEISGLGDRLGAILVQLPPSLAFESGVAAAFFGMLAGETASPVACEPRHASWFTAEAEALLSEHRIARVAADPPIADRGGEPGGWRGLAYFRWHGSPAMYRSNYEAETLETLAAKLRNQAAVSAAIWSIFDNTTLSHALENARELASACRNQV